MKTATAKPTRRKCCSPRSAQPQHDHSTHAFVFGPDGKLYWNVGNSGQAVHDKDGKPIVDLAGNVVNDSGKPYRQGMVFRCNLDGSEFEVLGYNFRNNYEVAVDSFGTLWQTDNDDDGNRGVRINYVMEFGNYGYTDEMTGAGWKTPRTNLETEIPQRHWHQNDPGVVPNLLVTGAGSPTGICVYEGSLLPKVFQNQVIHCDAGPERLPGLSGDRRRRRLQGRDRQHPRRHARQLVPPVRRVRRSGRLADRGRLVRSGRRRPPHGRHRQGTHLPRRSAGQPIRMYRSTTFDTADGAIAALESPNLSARYLAWTALARRCKPRPSRR